MGGMLWLLYRPRDTAGTRPGRRFAEAGAPPHRRSFRSAGEEHDQNRAEPDKDQAQ